MNRLDYFNIFFDCINKVNPMTEYDKQLCLDYFEVAKFPKNTVIEKAGKTHVYENFLVSGILRKYRLEDNGIEVTSAISTESCFFSCISSYKEREISKENLESITDCVLIRAKRENIDLILKHGNTLHQYTFSVFQKIIEREKSNAYDLINLSATERYLKFTEIYPYLVQNVPLQYIASLLGITPQSLSRIRKEITEY